MPGIGSTRPTLGRLMSATTSVRPDQSTRTASHFGLAVDSIEEAVKYFRANGVTASDPGAPSAFSHARLANATDLNGIRIELAELTPESLQRKAIDSWK